MRMCICQICQCGRHKCDVHEKRDPFAKGDLDPKPLTEHKERYRPFGLQPRHGPIVPLGDSTLKSTEPMAKSSMTKDDYIPYGLTKKRSLMRPKRGKVGDSGVKMADSTTYGKAYRYPGSVVPVRGKKITSQADGTMPGTLPGYIEGISTYARAYTPKPLSRRKIALPQANNLHISKQPFAGTTETTLRYQAPPTTRRVPAKGMEGELKIGGQFEGESTTKSDFPVYPRQEPTMSCKKLVSWTPGSDKFDGQTMYKSQFKYPVNVGQPERRIPKSSIEEPSGPFEGKSVFKTDFPAYPTLKKVDPTWIPSRTYKPPTVPMAGCTSYKHDYLSPPEDMPSPQKIRPQKGNLTCAEGPMEDRTTQMRDYLPVENPTMRESFKPKSDYHKPKGKIIDQSMTGKDYTWKDGAKPTQVKQKDNLVPDLSPMDDLTMTMKDFQWLAIDCPAAYIKNLGKDALPQFKFDQVVGGHEYFKKSKKVKNIC